LEIMIRSGLMKLIEHRCHGIFLGMSHRTTS
jgi:hypothetical protein